MKELTDRLDKQNLTYEIPKDVLHYANTDISFYVYTQSSTGGTKLSYDARISARSSSSMAGPIATYESDVNTLIRAALLTYDNVNVISVDWSSYSFLLYTMAVSNVSNVGKTVGLFIESLLTNYDYSPDDVILIGRSLGAHVAGYAGKELNGTLGVIVGLDPAGPLFFESNSASRLNSGNAQFLGVNYDLADTDFWPNGEYSQPGCLLSSICFHSRSYMYMAESIGSNQFYARQCDSYDDYTGGACATNTLYLMGGLTFDDRSVRK
ncbi:hypothetical protein GWI33_020603 [Rhynchophorus ferrugineus]|uniref:Lipase domain-containing protein n=1 Tax=Rhynchophorus ferrugineus TaxID=354439 RepID=A0A834M368_RHYFE|nr:hypothetical protein GWI33_020603 [Rhynchophorus ferrugineus]